MAEKPFDDGPSNSVSDAVASRRTIRAFTDTPVPLDTIRGILTKAQRSPSGGNLQPWRTHVLTGEALEQFRSAALSSAQSAPEAPTHPAYPDPLWEPHTIWRRAVGIEMYGLMGIERGDKQGRINAGLRNAVFFDAPVGIIITSDIRNAMPQYMDIGIYLQSIMLLAREAGLHSAPQGWWRNMPSLCRKYLDFPSTEEVVVGIGIGYADNGAAVNRLYSARADIDERVNFYERAQRS